MDAKAWLVRGGRAGERDQWALDSGVAGLGFHEIPDLSAVMNTDHMREVVRDNIPGVTRPQTINYAAQLMAFSMSMTVGDVVVQPLKGTPYLAVGRITGDYKYDSANPDPGRRHIRTVDWIQKDLPRTSLGQDLLYSLGAFLTVCQIRRNDAAWRLAKVLTGAADPGARPSRGAPRDTQEEAAAVALDEDLAADPVGFDVLRYTKDRISSRVRESFDGHRLTELVAAILEQEGFKCTVSPPGRDGGIDILAGTGVFGMNAPRLVVQVKSQPTPVGDDILQKLHGAVSRNQADQGLLVALGGITKPARDELIGQHFQIAVWNSDDLIDAIFKHYNALPEDMQASLPLQKTWVLLEDSR
ncbi:restriction endonuclease [Arthrobacter sp. UYCu723]